MDNDTIVKRICQLENIDLKQWCPMTEWGEPSDVDFDKSFPLNRTYFYQDNCYKKRIRFVRYSSIDSYITLHFTKLRVSKIIKSIYTDGNSCYSLNHSKDISLKDIERTFKFKKIMKKMGR